MFSLVAAGTHFMLDLSALFLTIEVLDACKYHTTYSAAATLFDNVIQVVPPLSIITRYVYLFPLLYHTLISKKLPYLFTILFFLLIL